MSVSKSCGYTKKSCGYTSRVVDIQDKSIEADFSTLICRNGNKSV